MDEQTAKHQVADLLFEGSTYTEAVKHVAEDNNESIATIKSLIGDSDENSLHEG